MKNKKILISLIIIIAAVAAALIVSQSKKEGGLKILPFLSGEKPSQAAYGFSEKNDEKEAVKEALLMVKQGLEGKEPEYILFFMDVAEKVSYNAEKILSELKIQLGSDVKIHGSTSARGVLGYDDVHEGEVGALVMLGFAAPRIDFGVGGADLGSTKESARKAGRAAILAAMANAGKKDLPQLVYINMSPGKEEYALQGLKEIIGKETPAFGGTSGDFGLTGDWHQFANDRVYQNGIVVTAFYTNLKIGYAFEHGYDKSEKRGIVTKGVKAEEGGRIIYEIDNRPAGEVFNQWVGGLFTEELQKGEVKDIHVKNDFYPLARVFESGDGKTYQISIGIDSITYPDHYLTTFAPVREGDEVVLLHGNWEVLLNRGQSTTKLAMESRALSKDKVVFGIYTFCGGTNVMIPKEERPKLPRLIKNAAGKNMPFIGMYAWGEQLYMPGLGVEQGNLSTSMIIFSE